MNRAWISSVWSICSLLWLVCLPRTAGQFPISVQPYTTNWIGYDGTWSAFVVKLGNPRQWVYLMPCTATSQIWAIGASGCDDTAQCQIARGGTFLANKSTTFESLGGYSLGLNRYLGLSGKGYYGLDAVQLADNFTAQNQVIALVNDTEIWMGTLGLGIQGTVFDEGDSKSLLDSLASGNKSSIPSRSYGYTAGANYMLKEVPGSLTLGGYDAARIQPNNMSFTLDSNQQPTVFLRNIVASGYRDQDHQLLSGSNQGSFTIDSSTPFLWLPEQVADQFAQTFGLVYNDTLRLYFYPNQTAISAINNSTINFTLSDSSNSSAECQILSISGKAFTSNSLSYGFPGLNITPSATSIPYFPVRKAANSTQYTLGRMFLQETYLTVDYERNNFSVSQAIFSQDALTDMSLISILTPSAQALLSAATSSASTSRLSTGAIIGIAIGSTLLALLTISTLLILLVRRRRKAYTPSTQPSSIWTLLTHRSPPKSRFAELSGASHNPPAEIASTEVKELYSSITHAKELASHVLAAEIPDTPLREKKAAIFGVDHDPSTPVELPLRISIDYMRDQDSPNPPMYAAANSPAVSGRSLFPYPHSPLQGGVSRGGLSPGLGGIGGHSSSGSGSESGVSPLNSPLSPNGAAGTGTMWVSGESEREDESESGTNDTLQPGENLRPRDRSLSSATRESLNDQRLHHLHPAAGRRNTFDSPRYVIDEAEDVHVDLRYSAHSSTSRGGARESGASERTTEEPSESVTQSPATVRSRRFSWQSEE